MTVRIGLIGAGIMGADHARTIASGVGGAVLAAVQDKDRTRAEAVARSCGDARVLETPGQVIADPGVDALLVCSPDATHAPLAIASIAAGKPVLVEKPLAASLDECRAVIAAEMRAGRRMVQVGFMRRFDPGYLAMKEVVDQNRFGPPLFLHCQHRNAVGPDYLTSDLVIANSAVHEIDIARFVLGDEFAAVAVTSPRASSKAPGRQPQFIVLETRGGVVVDVEAFVDAGYGYEVKGELVCETGAVTLAPGPAVTTRAAGVESYPVEADWRARFRTAYRDQLIAWVGAIAAGTSVGSSAWDGYAASATAEACLTAWRTHARTPVALEPVPASYRQSL
jgi:myo-inositol 2-dehydrogenase/D-chiro-inositol 1-dehydrogenase